ncbi:MAG TPA: T9SS type A sorting domain-containing protein [Bacteroidia bacterium]|nr:T9SS type A sorting domain-containing protein [Bacteroidia bacterium]
MKKISLVLPATLLFASLFSFSHIKAQSFSISTIAGNGTAGFSGDGNAATSAELNYPTGIVSLSGGSFYIADYQNNRIRQISGTTISTIAGTATAGFSGDGSYATAAQLNQPMGIAVDNFSNIYIADFGNNRIREINSMGMISTIAGNGTAGYNGDGAPATATELNSPQAVAVNSSGAIYIADYGNNRIRTINSAGDIVTVAGNGTGGFTGDGTAATAAEIFHPTSITFDAAGNLYISDAGNNRIRKVNTAGIISTVAGNGTAAYAGDGLAATAASISSPYGISVDANNNLFIADYGNNRIRMVTSSGIISTVAGNGTAGFAGDGGAGTASELNYPHGTSVDASGNVYVADYQNFRIRELSLCNVVINANSSPTSICAGSSANLTASGATSYTWQPGSLAGSSLSVTPSSSTTYTVTGTNANGCSNTAMVAVLVNPLPTVSASAVPPAICYGSSATLTANGASTYYWTPGTGISQPSSASTQATPLSTITYTVSGTSSAGCTASQTVVVTVNPIPTVTATAAPTSVCGGATTTLSGSGASTYTWSPNTGLSSTIGASVTATLANTYTMTSNMSYSVTGTSAAGCVSAAAVVTVTVTPAPTGVTATSNAPVCAGGTLSFTGAATGAISYSWSGPNSFSSTVQNPSISGVTSAATGTYTFTATNANACPTTATLNITQAGPVNPTTNQTNITCNGAGNGSITVNTTGGTPPYTYSWSPTGATTQTLNNLAPGTYTVTTTDINGCNAISTASLTQPTVLSASILSSTNVTCNGGANGSATASVTGGTASYTYSWAPTGAITQTASNLPAGTYTVTVTDANGCTTVAPTVTITQPTAVSANLTAVNVTCNGASNGSITPNVTGGVSPYTYSWSNGFTTANLTNLAAGTYTLTVTDANGCTNNTNTSITQPTALSVTIPSSANPTCNGGIDGTATGAISGGVIPYSYSWNTNPIQNSATATALPAGTYTLTGTDANGCTANVTVTLTNPAPLAVTATASSPSICLGTSATLTAAGAQDYTWLPTTGLSFSAGTIVSASPSSTTMYTVTGTSTVGCTGTATVTISVLAPPTVSVNTTGGLCGGSLGSATATPGGGTAPYKYIWSNGDNSSVAANLVTGVYQITIVDANNCSVSASATITNTNGPSITPTITNASCSGADNGSVSIAVTGGTAPYRYAWSAANQTLKACTSATQDTTQVLSSVGEGTYQVTVTDATGCTTIQSYSIAQPAFLSIHTNSTNAACLSSNGSAGVTVSGGTTPYVYSWNGASTTTSASMTGLPAGVYNVLVTDKNGCFDSATVLVNNTNGPVVNGIGILDYSCVNQTPGSVSISDSGGTAPYTYSWSNGVTTSNLTGAIPGNYNLTVTDNNGCKGNASAYVPDELPLGLPICEVTVDTNQKNLVVWNRTAERRIASYNIYRESSTGGSFIVVGNVCANQLSQFQDSVANSAILSYNYELTEIDSCGDESPVSPTINSIHLTAAIAPGDTSIDLIWNPYEGVFGNYYYIYRDTLKNTYTKYDSVSNTTLAYTDFKPLITNKQVYYTIGVENPAGCNPTARTLAAINYNASKSNTGNITFHGPLGIEMITAENNSLEIYPNPTTGLFTIDISLTGTKQNIDIKILNTLGEVLASDNNANVSGSMKKQIDLTAYSKGVYFVQVTTSHGVLYRKVVIQ